VVHGRADYDWTLRRLDGERVQLGAYRGRVLFINVWASWCLPCVAEMASITRLRDSLRDTGVEFLLVSPEEREPVERFLRRYDYDLPVLLEAQEMPRAFGLRALPTTYVVDRSGNIVLKHRGAADWDSEAVRDFLQALIR
jgi:thiol-disulfide isomerase/thioredoxin